MWTGTLCWCIRPPHSPFTWYSRMYSHLLDIYSMHVSLLPVAVNDNIYWKKALSTRLLLPLSEIVQIRSVLEFPIPLLQYPISSWHFLLIVMATDSVIFHWIWTGINVGNQLWVTVDPLFYLRPVFNLLWLHTVVWLLLLPPDDHCVLSASHGSVCTRENGILHQYRPFLIYELPSDYLS